MKFRFAAFLIFGMVGWADISLLAQPKEPDKKGIVGKKDFVGPGGFGPPGMQERKLVKQFDKDSDGRLNNEERLAARDFIKKQGGPGGKFGFGPGGKGGKGVFGPGLFWAKPMLAALDADKDAKLTQEELVVGLKKFIADIDKAKKDSIDEKQIAAGLNHLFKDLPSPFPKPPLPPKAGEFKFTIPQPGDMFASSIVKRADANKDGKITLNEMVAAAEALAKEADGSKDGKLEEAELGQGISLLFPTTAFGPMGGFKRDPAKPGPRVSPADVENHPKAPLYEPTVLRTLFLEFENKDWEAELADFYRSDVEVPATLTVDGKKYPNVGVHFRGMSSYFTVPAGYKRSLNLALDFVDPKQKLYGYRTLNLLNAHEDPSLLSTVLFSHIARQHIPAPKANLVKVVINGESWGVYVNVQQFNREFVQENYKTTKGARWKVKGSPGAGGGLEYLGDNIEDYKRRYEIKSGDNAKDWKALVALCKTLNQTPLDKLEAALKPMLDIDGALWFLALDNALINNDGYWIRASDFNLYRDAKGRFHLSPHDMNEAFRPALPFGFGPGFGPGPGKGPGPGPMPKFGKGPGFGPPSQGVELDPLIGLDDPRKPLRSRLLAVPSLKARYLEHVKAIAAELDWKMLGPVVAQYRALIEKEVELDTRKLTPLAEFKRAIADAPAPAAKGPGRGPGMSLRAFADLRGAYLLSYREGQKATEPKKEETP